MKHIKLNVRARTGTGRGPAKRLRASGQVPAVLYGKHTEAVPLAVEGSEISRLLRETAGAAALIELAREGEKPTLSVVQEVQRNAITDKIIHIDFHEVSAREAMETHVNVHLVGESIGVKNENGVIDLSAFQITVKCLPKDLPGFIEVDVTDLHVGGMVHVKDLPKYEGVEYLADPDLVVVSCIEQRVDSAVAAEEAEAEEAAAEPEKKTEKAAE